MTFNPFRQLLLNQQVMILLLKGLREKMSDSTTATTVGFADVQAAITQVVNDNTTQNNAVAAQLKEVTQLILDFSASTQAGTPPTQAEFQAAIAQLQAVHAQVQSNTASVQASGAAIVQADPNAAPPVTTPPVDVPPTDGSGGATPAK